MLRPYKTDGPNLPNFSLYQFLNSKHISFSNTASTINSQMLLDESVLLDSASDDVTQSLAERSSESRDILLKEFASTSTNAQTHELSNAVTKSKKLVDRPQKENAPP